MTVFFSKWYFGLAWKKISDGCLVEGLLFLLTFGGGAVDGPGTGSAPFAPPDEEEDDDDVEGCCEERMMLRPE